MRLRNILDELDLEQQREAEAKLFAAKLPEHKGLLGRWYGHILPSSAGGHLGETYSVSLPYGDVSGEFDDGTYEQALLEVSIVYTTPRSDQRGVVLRVRQVGGFDGGYPAARQTEDGVEIHIPLQGAPELLIRALRAVLAAVP